MPFFWAFHILDSVEQEKQNAETHAEIHVNAKQNKKKARR